MEIAKISDRVDALENDSNNGAEENKSVGGVNIEFTGLSDLIHSRTYNPSYGNGQSSIDKSEITEKLTQEDPRRKRIKLETSVETLIENASVDKTEVSEQMNQIKSSVALMKTGLTTKINHLAENINGTHTFAASCQEYFDRGNRVNGSFKIRPDPKEHAFDVDCEFNENQGITILKPDQWKHEGFTFPPTEDQRCTKANCFTHNFEYSASTDQIKALADISTNCSQSIKHTCTVNPLTKYSSWINRNGIVNTYWSGTRDPSETGCQCFIDGTCVEALNSDSVCNCDTFGANLVDDGILTDKNSIPVKALRYGGAMTIFSSVKYILGPFVCSGKARIHLQVGDPIFHPKTAKSYPSEQAAVEQEKIQNQLTTMSAKLNELYNRREPVYAFRVTSVKNPHSSYTRISTYDPVIWKTTEYNIGNGLNINNGKFTAPVDGIYFFNSQARSLGSNQAQLAFLMNGSSKSYAYRNEDGEEDTVTLSSQFKLHKGDTVWVRFQGYFYNPTNEQKTHFEGHLIRQINS